MPTITWNETRDRALSFSREWANARIEQSDKQTFWNEFFHCFGVPRKSVAVFEHSIANAHGTYNYLDLFWTGVLLVEHKSRGASLSKAESQAFNYLTDLASKGRHDEVPRYIILCDFARFSLFDLEPNNKDNLPQFEDGRPYRHIEFSLPELHNYVREFSFIKGEKPVRLDPEDPANFKATQLLANLHDALENTGFAGHELERLLVRILFCLFAEDTGIFDSPGCFMALIQRTREDGSDLGPQLAQLFQVLNTPDDKRWNNLDDDLAAFPFVNGGLFKENLPIASFNFDHRNALLACCHFHWGRISPAVFGSLFQGIMDKKERRQLGAHYTSERDIMKLLRSLFLDDLRADLDSALANRSSKRAKRLRDCQKKLRSLRFFDPACGCGNFLILAYRELRKLEKELLIALNTNAEGKIHRELDIRHLAQVDVDQFYGLEICEWPVRIAEVGLWLADHQSNVELAEALGHNFRRLPLITSPTLTTGNSLQMKWHEFLPPSETTYVLGNPPYVGKKEQNQEQKADVTRIWEGGKGTGILDYVTCWYRKAAEYIQGTRIKCGFVSTNSITQGEQVGILWRSLFEKWKIKIQFAHRTFSWTSKAKGSAHVHVVIIGFAAFNVRTKKIYEYDKSNEHPDLSITENIGPYLVSGGDTTVITRTKPINGGPEINYGSMMIDKDRKDGDDTGLLLTREHRDALITETPKIKPYIREIYGGEEFLNGTVRWCLWLVDAPPHLLRQSPLLQARVNKVREFREKSSRPQTNKLANTPSLFGEIRQPTTPYLLIPKVSSENRRYIPIGFLQPGIIASGSALIIPDATLFHFGVLCSSMHNSWMRCVAGRLESRYQYSANIVYNNFIWPSDVSPRNKGLVETAAQEVLDARSKYPDSTLADLYDQLSMPAVLAKAHSTLDRLVDRCYRKKPFPSDRSRVEHLFYLYEILTAPMLRTSTRRHKVK